MSGEGGQVADSWENQADSANDVTSKMSSLNVNAASFVPNVNAPVFVPSWGAPPPPAPAAAAAPAQTPVVSLATNSKSA